MCFHVLSVDFVNTLRQFRQQIVNLVVNRSSISSADRQFCRQHFVNIVKASSILSSTLRQFRQRIVNLVINTSSISSAIVSLVASTSSISLAHRQFVREHVVNFISTSSRDCHPGCPCIVNFVKGSAIDPARPVVDIANIVNVVLRSSSSQFLHHALGALPAGRVSLGGRCARICSQVPWRGRRIDASPAQGLSRAVPMPRALPRRLERCRKCGSPELSARPSKARISRELSAHCRPRPLARCHGSPRWTTLKDGSKGRPWPQRACALRSSQPFDRCCGLRHQARNANSAM